jgi:cytochrome bd-type quinol oxidase subunit 2
MKKVIEYSLTVIIAGVIAFSLVSADSALALDCSIGGVSGSEVCGDINNGNAKVGGVITGITQIFMYIVGALAVIMIIISGIMYATWAVGDPSRQKSMRHMMIYSLVGLIVAILAYAIAFFVEGRINTAP